MTGRNTLTLTTAEMVKAVEYYLHAEVFQEDHRDRVVSVKEDARGYAVSFVVELDDTAPSS